MECQPFVHYRTFGIVSSSISTSQLVETLNTQPSEIDPDLFSSNQPWFNRAVIMFGHEHVSRQSSGIVSGSTLQPPVK